MGESRKPGLRVDFDAKLRLEFHGTTITSDAGLLANRELDDALGLTEIAEVCLRDGRNGKNTRHGLGSKLRQSVFCRLAGYEDTNDAEMLSVDPVMRQVVGGRAVDHTAASTSQMGRFETETLTLPENQVALATLSASGWTGSGSAMPSGCPPTTSCPARLSISSRGQQDDRPRPLSSSTGMALVLNSLDEGAWSSKIGSGT